MNNWKYVDESQTTVAKIFEDGHWECRPANTIELAEGETIDAYEPPPPYVPNTVTMRQARLALFDSGRMSEFLSVLDALPSPQKERAYIEWEFSTDVRREDPLFTMISTGLNLSESDIDGFFTSASTL